MVGVSDLDFPEVESATLEIIKEKVVAHIPKDMIASCEVSIEDHPMIGSIAVQLTRKVAGQKLDTISYAIPKSWWQHFKQDHFPKWLRKKFPVQYHKRSWDVTAYYEHVALPDKVTSVHFMKK